MAPAVIDLNQKDYTAVARKILEETQIKDVDTEKIFRHFSMKIVDEFYSESEFAKVLGKVVAKFRIHLTEDQDLKQMLLDVEKRCFEKPND